MSYHHVLSSAFVLFISVIAGCASGRDPVAGKVKNHLERRLDSLDACAAHLLEASVNGDGRKARRAFLFTRVAFKKIEWYCEYYAPTISKELNGAPLPEIEIEENKLFEPSGFQVIEELLYPYNPASQAELTRQVRSLRSTLKRLRVILEDTELTEANIFEAGKLEIFRVMAMGISGFDTPLSKSGVGEAATAIQEVDAVLGLFGENSRFKEMGERAGMYLRDHQEFDSFNRMVFITKYANPLTREIERWRHELKIGPLTTELALTNGTPTFFEKNAFNISHFVNNLEADPTPEKIALGKSLFSDRMVSGSTQTCASCHDPAKAFTDGLPKSAALMSGKFVKRNAPTLLYAGLQNAQFYDMRSPTLENQAMDVIGNKEEMHASVDEAVIRLQKDPEYVARFKEAFPAMEGEIRPRYLMMALAAYIRSLNPFSSRFDQYMRGDETKMNNREVEGFNLFMGKAKCGTCHFMPLFNGTAPPFFSNTEGEVLGVPANPKARIPEIDPDEGRYFRTMIPELRFAFKTPTVRNVDRTAPYMHNGAYRTLDEVVEFYNQGGGAGIGIALDNQTLPADKLNLSVKERGAIVAFMRTLTDAGSIH